MKKRFIGTIFFLTFTIVAFAHEEAPIFPVYVVLTVDPTELTAVVRMDAIYMNNAVLSGTSDTPLPGTHWPAAAFERARTYVESRFTLGLNGQPLIASSFVPRFIQEPIGTTAPQFVFTLHYPLAAMTGRLSGRASFFSEAKHDEAPAPDEPTVHEEFITYLSVIGKETVRFELPLDKPNFELPLDGMARSTYARFVERLSKIAWQVVGSPFFWIVLIFAIVQGMKRWKKRKSAA